MNEPIHLETFLSTTAEKDQQGAAFAFLCLGVVESLASGTISVTDAIRLFFHADNCLFAHRQWHSKRLDEIMSRGVQLSDFLTRCPRTRSSASSNES